MKIGIVGNGVMGKLVAKNALNKEHEIAIIIDNSGEGADYKTLADVSVEDANKFDVLIDFSSPEAAMENVRQACRLKKPLVMATTGWYEHLDEAKELVEKAGIGFVWGSNFSVGVNLFWQVLEQASALLANQKDYDVFVHEFHHKRKKDSPSGTAITTAHKILENFPRKQKVITQTLDRPIAENELHLSSTRGGYMPGTHKVFFDSAFDTIELSHTARSGDGFAIGAIIAGEWIKDKTGFYDFAKMFSKLTNQ